VDLVERITKNMHTSFHCKHQLANDLSGLSWPQIKASDYNIKQRIHRNTELSNHLKATLHIVTLKETRQLLAQS
jgi:hypothetical protein